MTKGEVRDSQLASMITEELEFLLSTARDPRLAELTIKAVEAKPGGKHFVVYVAPEEGSEASIPEGEMKLLLKKASGFLRSELASSLNLKRAPDLTLMLYPL